MAFIPAPETNKVILSYESAQGNHAMNIIWVKDEEGESSSARLIQLLGIINSWATAEWENAAPTTWELDFISAQDWSVENSLIETLLPSVIGVSASPALPATTTKALSLRTGFAGRSNRGRLYHVGIPENAAVGDFIDATYMADLIDIYEQLRQDFIAADFTWSVASFVSGGVPRAGAVIRPITSIIATDSTLDTMRSRHMSS